ncbi:hypothetical protein [Leeuwenhoekiella marinoflava]|uniref:Uncharacterized protein n=2 Tax=Leeuwenhoekiella marinoflava TaxID=988 RepID=A0A4V1KSJ3_9FLAO|nr:hypothetical protein [Leeuwenhoekiella marinoflava]RXG31938.1 hypothetical protein DSL99_1240 [Leeuwenhoekiella marinoflava]SHE92291.1 hypothetical protein SAMN02745246_01297 [Leeuwenhoekiella marinoflava DSM 3653]
MSTKSNHNCCLGCKNGKPGKNQNCKVRLLKEERERKALSQEELANKYA